MPESFRSTRRRPAPRTRVADRLGVLAVLPFVAGAVLAWLPAPSLRDIAAHALSAYAATVVAFIGALHWGIAFTQSEPRPTLFVWGVVPAIVAWLALLLDPAPGLAIQAAMLIGCYLVDRRVYPVNGADGWLPLRLRLTVAATLCCAAGAIGLLR